MLVGLTAKQTQVWSLLAKGLNNEAIGNQLAISRTTVRRYIKSIYQFCDVERHQDYDPRVLAAKEFYMEFAE